MYIRLERWNNRRNSGMAEMKRLVRLVERSVGGRYRLPRPSHNASPSRIVPFARDTGGEARRGETRVHKNSMREGGWWAREEAGIKLAKRGRERERREGKRRRTREAKKERKETRAQRDSPCSIETKGGSGRMPIVFSPLGSYADAGEVKKKRKKKERGTDPECHPRISIYIYISPRLEKFQSIFTILFINMLA